MKNMVKSTFFKSNVILFTSLFSIEIIFRLVSQLSLFSWSVLRILFSTLILSTIVAYLIDFGKDIVKRIVTGVLVFAAATYSCVQMGFFNFLGVYASLQTSSQLGAVTSYIKDFIASFEWYYFLVFIPFILLLVYYFVFDKKFKDLKRGSKKLVNLLTVGILVVNSLLYTGSVMFKTFQNKYQTVSNVNLWLTASNPGVTVEQYGTVGFFFLDVKALLIPVNIKEEVVVERQEKKSVNEFSRIIDDLAWNKIISEEKDEGLNALNNYFINRDITDKNERTGMFKDKNLIVIMMESADDILINEKLYPNFYKLYSEGWHWENNFSPRNSCATMNNEFSGMTSLYSIYNTCTASKYKSHTYYQSIFNLFNNKDYTTFSAHNYTQAYYPRKAIHTNMGSGKYYGVESLGISYSNEYRNWSDDDDFMKAALKLIDKNVSKGEHFMTWLTTVSGHQPYNVSSIQGDRYYDISSKKLPVDVRRYMSKLKILDNGLGDLLEGLESRGILDDTVIVLYGDHYPYGISTSHLNKALDYNTSKDLDAERVPFVIYNPSMEPEVHSEYTSYVNILPTVANLFDLDYDPRLMIGSDLFDKNYQSLTVFADGSWKNEKAFYNASKNKINYYTSEEYSPEEIQKINDDIDKKTTYSNKAIKSNYYKYLEKKLTSTKEEIETLKEKQCFNIEKENYQNQVTENNQE